MRFGILRTKTIAGANVGGFILGTAMFSMFLMLTLYMQQVLGYSPMKTGVGVPRRCGHRDLLVGRRGAARDADRREAGARGRHDRAHRRARATSRRCRCDGSYLADLLPGFLLVGLGLGFSFVPISIAALAGVQPAEAGLASGLINTTQQIGGALGIAALSTIATSRTSDALPPALPCRRRSWTASRRRSSPGSVIAAVGVVAALTLIRRDELAPVAQEAEPALDLAA